MNMVKKKKLKNNILFEGSVHNKRKLYKLLKQSKIFVLPGPGGLAINEAMHAGLPIICSKADGTEKFLVKNKINGFFFKENSSLDLHKKLSSILQNKKLLISLGKNSKKIINNNFNSHLINKNYEKAFKL
jgi:glycosyltransferase involved in cell wall biosynthesis